MVMDVKNKAHRCDKPRPSLYATTGNEIYTNARWFSPQVWPMYFIIIHAFIYIRMDNNKIHI